LDAGTNGTNAIGNGRLNKWYHQTFILGSTISNLILILGICFVVGGIHNMIPKILIKQLHKQVQV